MTVIHDASPPQIPEILTELTRAHVDFVVTGSVAALALGVEVVPGDLDIVPATSPANLAALVEVLGRIEAHPPGPFGEWTTLSTGEERWIARATTEEEILAWKPRIDDVATLDHLFRTRWGDLDVVPEITGTHSALKAWAIQVSAFGCRPWIAHVDDLLARLTVPRREQDAPRVAQLRALQRGGRPWIAHVDDLLARLAVPRREQDAPRVAQLRAIQRRGSGTSIQRPSN